MKDNVKVSSSDKLFPVIVEKDERGFYVAECPIFRGCYTQAKTMEKALSEIKDVIEMCIEEKANKSIAENYDSESSSLHNIRVAVVTN